MSGDASKPTIAREIIANCLLMGMGAYPSPEDFADGILTRLAYEGFTVVSKAEVDKAASDLEQELAHKRLLRRTIAWQLERAKRLQQDLDEAVGYKLAVAQETRGDHGYEE